LTQEDVKGDSTSVAGITETLRNYTGFGRVVVDLGRALARDTGANLELEDGDALYIPPRSNVVTVVGEVRRTGSITFEKGLSLNDYLSLAAGTTKRSDVDNLYVVKASGEVQRGESSWTQFTRATPMIEPGDTIVVPVNTQYKDSIPFWRDITQIIYQGTVTIAAALRF
jgi:polysaccharide export outer membrane protein